MDTLSIVLLALIAALGVAQAIFLVRLALEGRRMIRGLEDMADRLVSDLTPMARDLARATANGVQVSETALAEATRLDSAVQQATEAWSETTARIHEAVVPSIGRAAAVAAAWRVGRQAFAIYRRFRR